MAAWGIGLPPDKYGAHWVFYLKTATMHDPAWEVFVVRLHHAASPLYDQDRTL
jgi:hypothetical protein